ncbi:MAG: hypothetical protein ACRDTG_24465 [Pseudonocardiaceae bacterium]
MNEDSQQQESASQSSPRPHRGAISSKLRPPVNVRIAFVLWVCFSVILIVLLIVTWSAPEPSSDRLQIPLEWREHPAQRKADAARLAGMIIAFLLQSGLVVGMLVIAIRMRSGSNRARVALAVIGTGIVLLILAITVSYLASVASIGVYFSVRLLIGVGLLVLLAGAISLMFRPRVDGFFR